MEARFRRMTTVKGEPRPGAPPTDIVTVIGLRIKMRIADCPSSGHLADLVAKYLEAANAHGPAFVVTRTITGAFLLQFPSLVITQEALDGLMGAFTRAPNQ